MKRDKSGTSEESDISETDISELSLPTSSEDETSPERNPKPYPSLQINAETTDNGEVRGSVNRTNGTSDSMGQNTAGAGSTRTVHYSPKSKRARVTFQPQHEIIPFTDYVVSQAQVLANLADQMATMGPADTFSGRPDENLETWLERFEASTMQVSSEEKKLAILRSRLRDDARAAMNTLPANYTLYDLVDQLHKYFSSRNPEHWQAELLAGRRQDNEPLRRCYLRVTTMVSQAFPELNAASQERLTIHHFCHWLGTLGEKIRRRKPRDGQDAIEKAELYEIEERQCRRAKKEGAGLAETVTRLNALPSAMNGDREKQLQERIEFLTREVERFKSQHNKPDLESGNVPQA